MRVSEIFASIAGEGSWMGRPSIFIRFSGCNLSCEWCDEKHARTGENLSVSEVVEKLTEMNFSIRRVVITGGEPLLQKESCVKLITELKKLNYAVMIETNGTLLNRLNQEEKEAVRSCEITVSPKRGKISGNAIRAAISLASQFKFVIGEEEGAWRLEDVKKAVEKYGISKEVVWLMPMSVNDTIDDELAREIWEFCVREGYNYSDRLHVRIWKNIRGK